MDPVLNSLNKHYKNCMVESKENCKFDLGVKGLVNLQQGQIFSGEQIQKGLVNLSVNLSDLLALDTT